MRNVELEKVFTLKSVSNKESYVVNRLGGYQRLLVHMKELDSTCQENGKPLLLQKGAKADLFYSYCVYSYLMGTLNGPEKPLVDLDYDSIKILCSNIVTHNEKKSMEEKIDFLKRHPKSGYMPNSGEIDFYIKCDSIETQGISLSVFSVGISDGKLCKDARVEIIPVEGIEIVPINSMYDMTDSNFTVCANNYYALSALFVDFLKEMQRNSLSGFPTVRNTIFFKTKDGIRLGYVTDIVGDYVALLTPQLVGGLYRGAKLPPSKILNLINSSIFIDGQYEDADIVERCSESRATANLLRHCTPTAEMLELSTFYDLGLELDEHYNKSNAIDSNVIDIMEAYKCGVLGPFGINHVLLGMPSVNPFRLLR